MWRASQALGGAPSAFVARRSSDEDNRRRWERSAARVQSRYLLPAAPLLIMPTAAFALQEPTSSRRRERCGPAPNAGLLPRTLRAPCSRYFLHSENPGADFGFF